jgi:hypothetical protein
MEEKGILIPRRKKKFKLIIFFREFLEFSVCFGAGCYSQEQILYM